MYTNEIKYTLVDLYANLDDYFLDIEFRVEDVQATGCDDAEEHGQEGQCADQLVPSAERLEDIRQRAERGVEDAIAKARI